MYVHISIVLYRYIYAHLCIYLCTHIYIYTYLHIHTCTHTYGLYYEELAYLIIQAEMAHKLLSASQRHRKAYRVGRFES